MAGAVRVEWAHGRHEMALIQFTRNHPDHSTDKGYQFEFFCDRCGNGFMSEFKPSAAGYATTVLRAAGDMFGGIFRSASAGSYEIERAVRGPAHDTAYRECVEETKPHFRQCPKCASGSARRRAGTRGATSATSARRTSRPRLPPPRRSPRRSRSARRWRSRTSPRISTSPSDATALCPGCGARTEGAKFCPECGKPLRPKNECPRCGTKMEAKAKFCPECGQRAG